MAGGRGPESFEKRQREKRKQRKRLEKLARRKARNLQKREAKNTEGSVPPPSSDESLPEPASPPDGGGSGPAPSPQVVAP